MTTFHLATVDADGRMTIYATARTESMAERMLTALHAAGQRDVQIVPIGRARTFREAYGDEVAA